jgi:hypothetical protein
METTIEIVRVLTHTQDNLQDVVKRIYYNLTGTKSGVSYTSQNHWVDLSAADPNNFIPYSQLTKPQLEAMITSSSSYTGLKSHIERTLDDKIAETSLTEKPLPFST